MAGSATTREIHSKLTSRNASVHLHSTPVPGCHRWVSCLVLGLRTGSAGSKPSVPGPPPMIQRAWRRAVDLLATALLVFDQVKRQLIACGLWRSQRRSSGEQAYRQRRSQDPHPGAKTHAGPPAQGVKPALRWNAEPHPAAGTTTNRSFSGRLRRRPWRRPGHIAAGDVVPTRDQPTGWETPIQRDPLSFLPQPAGW